MSVGRILDRGQRLDDSRVHRSVIEFVFAIVGKKEFQALANDGFVDGIGFIAQRALNQNGSAVAYITGDNVIGQLGTSDMAQGGVDRVHQVEARIDQGAVEIENDKLDGVGIKTALLTNHASSRINDSAPCGTQYAPPFALSS